MADTTESLSIIESDPLIPSEGNKKEEEERGSTAFSNKSVNIISGKPNYQFPKPSRISENVKQVQTPHGSITITLQGNPQKPTILTYHDIGMNHYSCFSSFMSDVNMSELLPLFHWVHIDAPGQEEGAESFSEQFVYPSVNDLAEQIGLVVEYLELSHIIGFGVGAGANILTRYAILSPETVRGLVLVNLSTDSQHWSDLSYLSDKLVSWLLKTNLLQDRVEKYLMNHSFTSTQSDPDLVSTYHEYFQRQNPHNLSLFLESYSKRTPIFTRLAKETKCHWLFVMSGGDEKSVKSVIEFQGQVGPSKSTILEVGKCVIKKTSLAASSFENDLLNAYLPNVKYYLNLHECGHLVLEEHPEKVATSFRLFLQGLGQAVTLGVTKSNSSIDNNRNKEELCLQGVSVETKL